MSKKSRPKKFSVVKAVKAIARQRVGQPKPQKAIEDLTERRERKNKHKQTLSQLLGE